MCTGAYVAVAVSRVDYVTMLHVHQVGFEGTGWLCKLSECLMAYVQRL